ncbi:MAG TPA: exonuclease domain-containing protein [Gaiellaceae bacterium]|nr:exonuclease domain-containing protein [Gaiellaceae bacterium]
MQLRMDAADRLVELLEERRAPVPASEAARALFALSRAPAGLARTLLDDVVSSDARLTWAGAALALARDGTADLPLDATTFVVVDLETTGLSARTAEICEIGAVRVRGLEIAGTFETLVRPRDALPAPVAALTGLRDAELRRAPPAAVAVQRFVAFAGASVLAAHNARFDVAFLDRALDRLNGQRIAAAIVDTVPLARALLGGRAPRTSLAALAHFFGTAAQPCHRALPDALATAEILVALVGLAQERGARTVGDLCRIAAPRARRAHDKRSLAFGAPTRPGVYVFRGREEQPLYVGKARDLRARLRSYFGSDRQRPAVEAALAAVERIEWHVLGSELEAALEELRLLRQLRPPANARSTRPDRHVYLELRGDRVAVTSTPTPLGPIRSRRRAELAARALAGASPDALAGLVRGAPLTRLRARLGVLADAQRYEDAARLRDRIDALERVVGDLRELERLRRAELCILAPASEEAFVRAFVLAGGRIAFSRLLPRGGGAVLEAGAAVAEARRTAGDPSCAPEHADELLVVGAFLRRPPPELVVVPLDPGAIAAACANSGRALAVA